MRLLTAFLLAPLIYAADASVTIAALRILPSEWDKEANLERLKQWTRKAAAAGAEVVVTPEGYLEGYVGNDKKVRDLTKDRYYSVGESIDGRMLTDIRNLAKELKIHLLVGFAEKRDGQMWNSAAIFAPDGSLTKRYSKTHTANDEPFNAKGTELPTFETPWGRWGALICMDRQLPETSRILAIKGARLILVPAWGSFGEMNETMMRTRAYENGVWVVFVHPKNTMFINPKGKVVARDEPAAGDQIVAAKVEIRDDARNGSPIRFRRPELYGDIAK